MADKKKQIVNLSTKHQILSHYTAFICVEKELVDGNYQEIKDKGQTKVKVQERSYLQKKKPDEEG